MVLGGTARSSCVYVGVQHSGARVTVLGDTARSSLAYDGGQHNDASAAVLDGTARSNCAHGDVQADDVSAPELGDTARSMCARAVYSTTLQARRRLAVLQVRRLSAAPRGATACTSAYGTTMLQVRRYSAARRRIAQPYRCVGARHHCEKHVCTWQCIAPRYRYGSAWRYCRCGDSWRHYEERLRARRRTAQ